MHGAQAASGGSATQNADSQITQNRTTTVTSATSHQPPEPRAAARSDRPLGEMT